MRALKPLPHQKAAVTAAVAGLRKHGRGQVIMACGTGKTLVGAEVVQQMRAQTVVVFVPSIALVAQLLDVYRQHMPRNQYLAVCSDKSIGFDETVVDLDSFSCPVTTDRKAIRAFLEARGAGRKFVICTYHSAPLLKGCQFDLGVFDEAHRTAGKVDRAFSFALRDVNTKIARRLFMTATPRHCEIDESTHEAPVFSMDDPKVYGPVFYSLSFRKAIDLGLICDYRIVVATINESPIRDRQATTKDVQVALRRAMQKYGTRSAFTFHSTIAGATKFAAAWGRAGVHINGAMSSRERETRFAAFRRAESAILTNVRCLGEGVDAPAVDMVGFLTRKRSPIDIVQAVGRALRLHPGNPRKRAIIFVPLFWAVGSEDTEAAVHRARFSDIWAVLQAMREQDSVLDARLKIREARISQDPDGVVQLLDTHATQLNARIYRSISTRLVKPWAPAAKKAELLTLAKTGAPRPHGRTEIGSALHRYINPAGVMYDAVFTQMVKAAAPQWFIDTVAQNKAALLAMASSTAPRPPTTTKLGGKLWIYTHKSTKLYDADFARKIGAAAPHWLRNKVDMKKDELLTLARTGQHIHRKKRTEFLRYTRPGTTSFDAAFTRKIKMLAPHWFVDRVAETKAAFLLLARTGKPRPKGKLGSRLSAYTSPSGTNPMFDSAFTKTIKIAAPHWFGSSATKNKMVLLAMARAGKPRPKDNTKIGHCFPNYLRPTASTFDADFARKIKIAAPQWFVDTVKQNKMVLLAMARAGKPRPQRPHKLAQAINTYRKDARFMRELKTLAPHWFTSTEVKNKTRLLTMARAGEPRPQYATQIGRRLTAYTRPAQSAFDPDFTRKIKILAPHWFKRL